MASNTIALDIVKIHESDNVVVAVKALEKGHAITVDNRQISLKTDVPAGHKIALHDVPENAKIVKYGHIIGHATQPIAAGEWVHSHNLATDLSGELNYSYQPNPKAESRIPAQIPTFLGYRRANGRVGTRNDIWIVNTVGCVNRSA